ncbi:MAG: hypothetical protein Q9223_001567 [Gallowayella weberi]
MTALTGGLGVLPPGWDPVFHILGGANNQVPDPAAIFNLNAEQDRSFINSQEDSVQDSTYGRYSQLTCNLDRLRYVGDHFISNPDTSGIIDRPLKAAFETDTPTVDWPGASSDIETDEAKALSRLRTAWALLIC